MYEFCPSPKIVALIISGIVSGERRIYSYEIMLLGHLVHLVFDLDFRWYRLVLHGYRDR